MAIVKKKAQKMAAETLEQLGGHGKIKAMINAKRVSHDNGGALFFTFSGSHKMNEVRIEVTTMDTYDMTLYKDGTHVEEHNDIYGGQLQKVFEQATGLYLSI